jgi:hypothetical protein
MYSLVAITGVTEVRERDNAKGLVCLINTPKGVEQAVISCNVRCWNAAEAIFEHARKSIADHQKNMQGGAKPARVRFLH